MSVVADFHRAHFLAVRTALWLRLLPEDSGIEQRPISRATVRRPLVHHSDVHKALGEALSLDLVVLGGFIVRLLSRAVVDDCATLVLFKSLVEHVVEVGSGG